MQGDCVFGAIHMALERNHQGDWVMQDMISRPTEGLTYVQEGALIMRQGRQERRLEPHSLTRLRRGARYGTRAAGEDVHFFVVNFDLPGEDGYPLPDSILLSGETEEIIARHFKDMAHSFRVQEALCALKCRSMLAHVLYMAALSQDAANPPGDGRIAQAAAYMREHYGERISVESTAAAARLSMTHFRRLFEDEMGMSPHAYLNELRMRRAKALLASGLYTIDEIAQRTGFSDVYYFSRAFKRETGLPPSRWVRHGL